jgi:hypothetical protein
MAENENELELGGQVKGRIFTVTVYGDTASEIEIAALAAAQPFFGDGVPLEVIQDYMVSRTTPHEQAKAGDKKYVTWVRVRALVQPL